MARPTRAEVDLLVLRYLNGEATVKDIESYWKCSTARAYQLINAVAHKATGNYRERNGRVISAILAQKEIRQRVFAYHDEDTPEAFYERGEIDHRN